MTRRPSTNSFDARALLSDRSGTTAITFALLGTILLGFLGLGIDMGSAYYARRSAQNAADSAATSAAVTLASAGAGVSGEARAIAAGYGFAHDVNGTAVLVSSPPTTGAHTGDAKAVEVLIERPARRFFSALFSSGDDMIRARAVARVSPSGNACVVALSSTAEASALETGSANINLEGCSLYSNSTSATAFTLKGAAEFRADSVNVVGGYSIGNNATLTTVSGIHTNQASIADPYKDVTVPPYSGCTYNGASLSSGTYGNGSGSPTVFCNGLRLNSGVSVTLNPGIYIVDRGSFVVNGGATLKGTGVTIVLTSSTGSDYATMQINGGATVDLTAPTSGPMAGLVLYQDRRAPEGGNNSLSGGSSQKLKGAVYFPNQIVTFTGGSSTETNGCLQLVASQVAFRGDSHFQMKCENSGIRRAGGSAVALVE
ncbi:TadE/TadG family type IV pilus assembly protein [Sphingosinicella humi]|uniref:Putative Flp pilus-assembly TadG-like N-terminal domain-containing protein n=1 Tax=Allosphingosinicella humi TaxID=2068657 RepID=A0A2U2J5W5_9SPHN|nr:pilus assembly protein TadG-related protein [Sphingosinicella humi]PWG03735.1 hypothetical protein DF286_13255 [Sphingosinicella humi]